MATSYKQYAHNCGFRALDDFYIADNATLLGDLKIGKGVSIWYGAVLRADDAPIEIGERTNIQDMTMVHANPGIPLIIGKNVTVGHQATLHCNKIGDSCLIGMGAILLENAEIGEHSLIAAGSVVAPNTVIPPRSLVMGIPGKVVKTFDDAQCAALLKPADKYFHHAKHLAEELSKASKA